MKYTRTFIEREMGGMGLSMRGTSGSWLGSAAHTALALCCLMLFASPALASGKKKSSEPKSIDDMMQEAPAKPKKGKAEEEEAAPAQPAEEEVAEPDAWEKPPEEEEKAPPKPAAKIVEPPSGDGRQFEAGLLLGYGFALDKGIFGPDPYGLGFGLRLGYELDFKLFIGAGFQYFLGSSDKYQLAGGGVGMGSVNASAHYMFLQVEAGYDLWVSTVIIRPSLALGVGIGNQDPHPQNNGSKTVSDFFIGPGVTVLYTMEQWFIGGDLRLLQVTGDGASALAFAATGGMRF